MQTNQKKFILLIILTLVAFLGIIKVSQATIYVDSARPDDSGVGTGWATAKKTIQAGVNLLNSGDTLKIKTGSYTAFYLKDKNFSTWTTIETDDGIGNPGLVTISGSVTSGWNGGNQTVIDIQNVSYLRIDGRQLGGFTILPTASFGIITWHWSAVSYITISYADIIGSVSGSGDASAILTDQYSNVEIGYCRINTTGSLFLIQLTGSGTGDPNYTNIGSVHHCDIQGNTNDGYSAISLTRFGQAEIYNNYIHNVKANSGVGPTLIRVRNGHDNKIYNNLLIINNGTTARNFFQTRAGGGAILVRRNQFYNNTAIIEGILAEAVCFTSEESSYNKCFNNLVIGNVNKFVDGWGISGSNNELYNNVITGSLNMWFASGWETAFSVTSGGTSNQGITFINLSGNKPSPYWDLSASKDGATAAGLITDYNEDTRNFPQDVGAFEYTLTDTTPPALSNGLPNSQLSAGATQATLSLTTDENATCRYSTSVGISYSSITNTFSTTGSTNHSTTVSGLSDGYNYNYYIRCQDTANNANVSDYSISFSVASPASDTTPPSAPTGLVVE